MVAMVTSCYGIVSDFVFHWSRFHGISKQLVSPEPRLAVNIPEPGLRIV